MKKFKCEWNTSATQEEYPANIPNYLPEFITEAEDKANALYLYEKWLKNNGTHPNMDDELPTLDQYIKKPFASGGWGMFATEI